LVIWPVKIVPEMTYYVSSGTLNPTHSHSSVHASTYSLHSVATAADTRLCEYSCMHCDYQTS